jgi:hypothetical protein
MEGEVSTASCPTFLGQDDRQTMRSSSRDRQVAFTWSESLAPNLATTKTPSDTQAVTH